MSKAVVFLADGFEECEGLLAVDLLRRAGCAVDTASISKQRQIISSHGVCLMADALADEVDFSDVDMIVLPGGLGGVASARASQAALDALKWAWDNSRFVAAICAGPTVLADLGITDGRNATCYPGCENQMGNAHMAADAAVIRDGRLITGTSAGCAVAFGLALIEALKGEQEAQRIANQIVIRT